MRLEMDRKREQITQMCAPRTSACDYPQSGCDGDVTTQEEAETEDACHGVGDTQKDMDACNTEGNSSNGKNVDLSQTCTDKDNETETTESSETNSSQSVTSNNSLKPRKSCLKRIHSESKNGQDVTQFNSNDRGSCRTVEILTWRKCWWLEPTSWTVRPHWRWNQSYHLKRRSWTAPISHRLKLAQQIMLTRAPHNTVVTTLNHSSTFNRYT